VSADVSSDLQRMKGLVKEIEPIVIEEDAEKKEEKKN
jgi:hypothetical protein